MEAAARIKKQLIDTIAQEARAQRQRARPLHAQPAERDEMHLRHRAETTGARGAARGPSMRWRAPTRDAAAPMGLAKHLRACVTVARVGFVPYHQTTAEHALLANAAANFGNICIGALACRHTHAPAGATAATRVKAGPGVSAGAWARALGRGRRMAGRLAVARAAELEQAGGHLLGYTTSPFGAHWGLSDLFYLT
ncbi:hypothetical protein T492DRAFT_886811 [Pavlovales sp. CCMP2436]|nr:hypothetical protein T492DRAFT_886811 [Pavlovales sp. CCMP2436]